MTKLMILLSTIDWEKVFAIWIAVEQVLANSKRIEANSTFQLVCNLIDAIVGVFKPKEKENVN